MTSARRIAANRRNARKSTGPRTTAGKARASRNARHHGLRVPLAPDATSARDIKRLARIIAGGSTMTNIVEWSQNAAEATLDLARVRRARTAVLDRMTASPQDAALCAETMQRLLPDLHRFDRYERRAVSRRDKALGAIRLFST